MTQTFRSRDEQQDEVFKCHVRGRAGYAYDLDEEQFTEHLKEAEARGAAEERGKDVEIAGYIPAGTANFFAISKAKYTTTALHRDQSSGYVPVYYSSNVAALEARIAELEVEKGRKQEEARRYRNALINICDKTSEFSISHKTARAALKREGGV